jgi:hypothetical protein
MKKTLQDQYLLIKEGKGHKGVFLNEAKRQFPSLIRNAATFEEAAIALKDKNIINENVIGVMPINSFEPTKKESYEVAFENFLKEAKKKAVEDEKAELKKPSKQVEEDLEKNFDREDDKNPDNLIFDQIMMGYYTEMKDPKNCDKTTQEIKDIVFKNLAKDSIFYTKEGQFGVKDLGYTTEAPGLGEPKEAKGKYKSSGYGDLNEAKELNVYGSLEEKKLRKAIRSIINEELEEIINISTKNTKGGGGKRYIPSEVFIPQTIIDKFNFSNPGENAPSRQESMQIPHIKFGVLKGNSIMLISDFLFNALTSLERGRSSREKEMGKNELEKLVSILDPMARGMIKKNVESKLSMGNYHVVNMPIEREKGVGVKIPLNKEEKEELEEMMLREALLKEGVEKELAAINKEVEHEGLQLKLEKINAAIEKRQSQLTKLDEDEDMKNLTDKKKVKELEKDIKALEKAKAKVEKMMGKSKGKKKEVIDETEEEIDFTSYDNMDDEFPSEY